MRTWRECSEGNEIPDSVSYNTDVPGNITSRHWYLGTERIGSGAAVTHTFPEPGVYTVTFKVTANHPDHEEWASDSVEVSILGVEIEKLEATDTNTAAEGTRTSTTTLVMVNTGTRTADITVSVSGTIPSGYPTWSGRDITGVTESTTATYSGTSDSEVKVTIADVSRSLNIDIVDERRFSANWNFDGERLKAVQEALRTVIRKISNEDVDLNVSGNLAVEFKRVDRYNDGNSFGHFAYISGTVTATFPDVGFSSPAIPVPGVPGVTIAIGGGFSSSSMSLKGETAYDQSLANPGKVDGTLSATTTVGLNATVELAVILVVTLGGSTTLSASGSIALVGRDINLGYTVSADDFTACAEGRLRIFSGEIEIFSVSHPFNFNASRTGTVTLHSFN